MFDGACTESIVGAVGTYVVLNIAPAYRNGSFDAFVCRVIRPHRCCSSF